MWTALHSQIFNQDGFHIKTPNVISPIDITCNKQQLKKKKQTPKTRILTWHPAWPFPEDIFQYSHCQTEQSKCFSVRSWWMTQNGWRWPWGWAGQLFVLGIRSCKRETACFMILDWTTATNNTNEVSSGGQRCHTAFMTQCLVEPFIWTNPLYSSMFKHCKRLWGWCAVGTSQTSSCGNWATSLKAGKIPKRDLVLAPCCVKTLIESIWPIRNEQEAQI